MTLAEWHSKVTHQTDQNAYAMSMSDPLGDCTEVMVLPG